jgi:hypothetical protein
MLKGTLLTARGGRLDEPEFLDEVDTGFIDAPLITDWHE